MSLAVTVRKAEISDLETIVAFNAAMAQGTENKTLDHATLTDGVRWALAHEEVCFYFVAEREGMIVGQCMVTFEWTDWRNGWLWWFQSVYVHADHRRTGVFRALYEYVQAKAKSRPDVRGLRLYVEGNNVSAMATYRDLGMVPSGHVVYERDWSTAR